MMFIQVQSFSDLGAGIPNHPGRLCPWALDAGLARPAAAAGLLTASAQAQQAAAKAAVPAKSLCATNSKPGGYSWVRSC